MPRQRGGRHGHDEERSGRRRPHPGVALGLKAIENGILVGVSLPEVLSGDEAMATALLDRFLYRSPRPHPVAI